MHPQDPLRQGLNQVKLPVTPDMPRPSPKFAELMVRAKLTVRKLHKESLSESYDYEEPEKGSSNGL